MKNERRCGMFNVGDVVIYGTEGVCIIKEMIERSFDDDVVEYYVLKPINKKTDTVVYVPTNNDHILKRMRAILTPEEIRNLSEIRVEYLSRWIVIDRERQKKYKEILLYGTSEDLVQLIRTIYLHQIKMLEMGKKLHVQDERILKEAERILTEEVVYVMGITPEEALPLVCPINRR